MQVVHDEQGCDGPVRIGTSCIKDADEGWVPYNSKRGKIWLQNMIMLHQRCVATIGLALGHTSMILFNSG